MQHQPCEAQCSKVTGKCWANRPLARSKVIDVLQEARRAALLKTLSGVHEVPETSAVESLQLDDDDPVISKSTQKRRKLTKVLDPIIKIKVPTYPQQDACSTEPSTSKTIVAGRKNQQGPNKYCNRVLNLRIWFSLIYSTAVQ